MTPTRISLAIGAALLASAALLYAADQHAAAASPTARPASTQHHAPAPSALPPLPGASTIHDEPIVAPDPRQNADHNITFPADI